MSEHKEIGKYISIIQRLNNAYFANQLSSYQIGCGQQFFLLQIFKKPGMSLHELASFGHYDKVTEMAQEDKRIRRIYVTEKATNVVGKTLESVNDWADILLKGFTNEERDAAEQMLIRMACNALDHIVEQKGKE